jgi:hypothetical protein
LFRRSGTAAATTLWSLAPAAGLFAAIIEVVA